MRLILSQLFYTSFPGIGFKTLASPQVPREIERAFTQKIVERYWNAYNPPPQGYQAVYLYQVTPEHTLFGWLYNDGNDELGRSHVPYFVCYHLAQPLLDFELEYLFNCLQLGPISLIDRHHPPETLPQFIVQDINTYQSVRKGVSIPTSLQKQSSIALQQCESIDLFVPEIDRHILQLDRSDRTQEHAATLSIYNSSPATADLSSNLIPEEPTLLIVHKEGESQNNLLSDLEVQEGLKNQKLKDVFILVGLFASILAFALGVYALVYTIKFSPNSTKNPSYIPMKFENAKVGL